MSADILQTHIHRWEPASSGQASRTLLLLHGTGGDENDLIGLGQQIDPGANLLSPRGNVLENGMPRFFKRLREGVFDLEDLKLRVHELARWIEAACAHYAISRDALYAVGFSNGANTAAAMMLLHPDVLSGAVLMRAMFPIAPETRPNLAGKRVLMLTGSADPIVPPESADALASALSGAGAKVTHHHLNAGHNLSRQDLILAGQFIHPVQPR